MDTTALRETLRRVKRKLTFWRVVALIAVALLIGIWLFPAGGAQHGPHIARVRVDGFILGKQQKIDIIDRLAKNEAVKAVIVRINSPGGTTSGAEAIYNALKRLAKKKPVVTVMDGVAASGGYLVALAGERMFASGNTITGSIGVIVQWPELSDLLNRVGVRMSTVRSGPLKALPNSVEPTPEEAKRVIREMVLDSYEWFVSLVAKRRGLDMAMAKKLADGRVYTGRQALKAKLIDALGDEYAARDWLAEKHKFPRTLKVVEYRPKKPLLQELGLPGVAAALLGIDATRLRATMGAGLAGLAGVDGLLSVWHPRLMPLGGQ